MEKLIESFIKLQKKLIALLELRYISDFFKSKENGIAIEEYVKSSITDIYTIVYNENLISLNYSLYVEQYYSLLNFYEELLEESSLFASNNICSMFTLTPPAIVYNNYFNDSLDEYQEFKTENFNLFSNNYKDTFSPTILEQVQEITDIFYEFVQQKKYKGELNTNIENMLQVLEKVTKKYSKNQSLSLEDSYLIFNTLEKIGEIFFNNNNDRELLQQSKIKLHSLKNDSKK